MEADRAGSIQLHLLHREQRDRGGSRGPYRFDVVDTQLRSYGHVSGVPVRSSSGSGSKGIGESTATRKKTWPCHW